jgi:HK97 family phage prohead protease
MEVETNGSSVMKIAGYANYSTKDRGNDVILPQAWEKGLDNYKKNPVVLYGHDHSKPIGTCTKFRVDSTGLYVEANISSAAEDLYKIQTLIKDGALKAFSVGFIPKKGRKDSATDTLYITELELLENSIVAVPMQQDSIFSIVKSFEKEGDFDKFMAESVEIFDSSEDLVLSEEEANKAAGIIPTEKDLIVENPERKDRGHLILASDITESTYPTVMKTIAPIINLLNTNDKIQANITGLAFRGKVKAKSGSKTYKITKLDSQKNEVSMQEVTILGNPIGEILVIDMTTLNNLNLTKVDTSDYVVFKMVDKRTNEEISSLFANLVKADIKELKNTLTQITLPNLAKKQLSYTIDLMEKSVKDWNPDDYIVANKIVDYILSRSHLEASETKDLLMLHGHVEENSEMTQPTVSDNATEEVVQQATSVAVEAAPIKSVTVA